MIGMASGSVREVRLRHPVCVRVRARVRAGSGLPVEGRTRVSRVKEVVLYTYNI